MTIVSSLVLALTVVVTFPTVFESRVSGMELEGEREVAVGDIATNTDEELTNEEVGTDKMLVVVVSVPVGSSLKKAIMIICKNILGRDSSLE